MRELSLGKIFGIEIAVNLSWIIIFLLLSANLSMAVFPMMHPEWSAPLYWIMGISASLLFFASILLHKLAHSLMAKAHGLGVEKITLFLFGGVSNLEREPTSPKMEFMITIVGPLTSIILGALLLVVGGFIAREELARPVENVLEIFHVLNPSLTLILWLGTVNVLVGMFNMIPGFPLDGGRILRSFLWGITGNLRLSTGLVYAKSLLISGVLMGTGLFMALGIQVPVLGTGFISGLWLILIGLFLGYVAGRSYRQVVIKDTLDKMKVEDVMRREFDVIQASDFLHDISPEQAFATKEKIFPVTKNGAMVGLLTADTLRKKMQKYNPAVRAEEIMKPLGKIDVVSAEEGMYEAYHKLSQSGENQIVVMENGSPAGIIHAQDLAGLLKKELREE